MGLTTAVLLFVSGSLYLIPLLMWVWLRPNKLPKPRTDDTNGGDPNPGLPLIPLPPGSPAARWLTDRSEKDQKVSAF